MVEGLTNADLAVADRLRRTHKPVILAVNKADNDNRELAAPEFYRLGLTDPLPISAYHNFGIYELMDQVLSYFPSMPEPEADGVDLESGPEDPGELKLAIVGRTNVGKSMLLNSILGQERSHRKPGGGHHQGCPRHQHDLPWARACFDRYRRHPAAGPGAARDREVQRHPGGERC